MDPRSFEAKDTVSLGAAGNGSAANWQEEARDWMAKRPEPASATVCSDRGCDKLNTKAELVETPEVKAAYKQLLEKTSAVNPTIVADSINLFGDFAAVNGKVPKLDLPQDAKPGTDSQGTDTAARPEVAQAYQRILQRGFNPVLIVDILNVGGDLAAIALSPEGKKLFNDIKSLISHLRN